MLRESWDGFLSKGNDGLRPFPCNRQQLHPDIVNINGNKRYQSQAGFIRVKIYRRDIVCRAIIDTGNLFHTVMSEEFHRGLGIGMEDTESPEVGTAHSTQTIKILGRSQPFQIYIEGMRKAFWVQPFVAQNIRHPLNLGRDFLAKERANLNFNEEHSFITIAGDSTRMITKRQPLLLTKFVDNRFQKIIDKVQSVPLLKSENIYWGGEQRQTAEPGEQRRTKESWKENVYCLHDQQVEAGSISFIDINIPDNHGISEIMIEPECLGSGKRAPEIMTCKGVYPFSGNIGKIAVMNPTENPVKIAAQTPIGSANGSFRIMAKQKETETAISELSHKPVSELTDKELQERRAYIITQLNLEGNKYIRKKPHLMEQIVTMFLRHFDAVAIDPSDFGKTNMTEFEINLEPGAKPVRHKIKPLNPTQLESLRKQIDDWIEADVIEPAVSPWGFRLVPVVKKNGRIRWCVDYRQLNAMTIKDSYPLSSIAGNLEMLQGAKIFSTLDSQGAYHTLPIAKESRDKTCFVSPLGSYQFKRLPFGVSNAPSAYSRFVDMVLQRLPPGFVLGYLDDLIIHSQDMKDHLQHLEMVLQLHVDTGMKLNMAKCDLLQDEVVYLGHQISADGVRMVDEYVNRVLKWEKPTTGKQMRTFLGFIGYYRQFFPDFARLTARMNGERNTDVIKWTEEMEKDFADIKEQFGKKPLRAYPDYGNPNPFIVTTDFSAKNVAGILSQEQDGQERFIAATGRKCMKTEAAYPSYKGEILALVVACRTWEHILRYRPFVVVTDAQALKFLNSLKDPKGMVLRWTIYLATFNFTVVHRAGKKNVNADGLSRCEHLPEATKEEMEEATADIATLGIQPIGPQEMKEAQEEDLILKQVKKWVKTQQRPAKDELKGQDRDLFLYRGIFETLGISADGVLMMTKLLNEDGQDVQRICVPRKYQKLTWELCHQHASSGHFGNAATAKRMKRKFYFPGMYRKIEEWNRQCNDCVQKESQARNKKGIYVDRNVGSPFEKCYVDLVGPLQETNRGNRYILTFEDSFTRWVEAIPIPNKESQTVSRALFQEVLSRYGMVEQIHSDMGREFCARIWQELMEMMKIKWTTTPPYNPRSNRVERFHRTMEAMLRANRDDDRKDWDEKLPTVMLAYRTTVHSVTQQTPYAALYGRQAILPVDMIFGLPHRQQMNLRSANEALREQLIAKYEQMRSAQRKQAQRTAQQYAGQREDFEIGNYVWYYTPRRTVGETKKINQSWTGPWIIIEKIAPILVRIKPANQDQPRPVVPLDRLRRYHITDMTGTQCWRSDDILEDFGDEYAEDLGPVQDEFLSETDKQAVHVTRPTPQAVIWDLPKQGKVQGTVEPETAEGVEIESSPVEPGHVLSRQDEPREGDDQFQDGEQSANSSKMEMDSWQAQSKRAREDSSASEDEGIDGGKNRYKRLAEDVTTDSDNARPTRQAKRSALSRILRGAVNTIGLEHQMHRLRTTPGPTVNVQLENIRSHVPTQGTAGAAGWDLYSVESVRLTPKEVRPINTGIRIAIPAGYFGKIEGRSGLARQGIFPVGGVVDADYRGPIWVLLYNSTEKPYVIEIGDRIAQMLILRCRTVQWEVVSQLSATERGCRNFGSTGVGCAGSTSSTFTGC